MIKTVAFLSQQAMENHVPPCANTAIISITSPGDAPANIKQGFHSVIRLQFDDLYEEVIKEKIGDVPDMELSGFIKWHGFVLPDARHAGAIVDFIQHAAGEGAEHIICHCHAGVSRSAAVAQFVADKYRAEIDQANQDTSCANARLLRLLNKASNGEQMTMGAYKELPASSLASMGPPVANMVDSRPYF